MKLRKTPYGNSKIESNVIGALGEDEYIKVHPLRTQTGWFLVMDKKGRQGFIYEDFLQIIGR